MGLRQAIEIAVHRRKAPPFDPSRVARIASALGMTTPISLSALESLLRSLPFATASFSSGPLTAGYVHGSAQLGLQSDGLTSFRGQVQEEGAVGDNYLIVATLIDVKDDSGKAPAFARSGSIAGKLNLFKKSEDDWQTDRAVELIQAQWDTAKNTRVTWKLHVSTDPIDVASLVSPVPGSGILIGLVLSSGPGGDAPDGTLCSWTSSAELNQCNKP